MRRGSAAAALVPRRSVYLLGVLAAVKAASLVLLAEAVARGVASLAAGDTGWRAALAIGVAGAAIRALATWGTAVAASRAGAGAKETIRARVLEAVLGGRPRVGPITALATRGIDDLDDYFTTALPAQVSVAVIPLVIGTRILFADWLSALIVVLTVPLIPVFMALVGLHTRDRTSASLAALSRLSDHIVELARGLPVLVGLGRVEDQSRSLERISDDYRRTTLLTLRTAFLSSLVLELIATLSVAIVAVSVGIRLLDGGMTLEAGLLVLILAPECYAPFRDLGAAYHSSRNGTEALARAEEVLAEESPASDHPAGPAVARGLTVRFPGRDVPALRAVSFDLPPHGVAVVRGPSGSGKSTLLRALAGRLDPEAVVTGTLIRPAGRTAWAPQHPRTIGLTVREEVDSYSRGVPAGRVEAVLGALGLSTLLGADPADLSPGELRRLAVARAILRVDAGALVLLLDEPTAHLDDESAAAVRDLIRETSRRVPVVIATHDATIAALAATTIALEATTLRDRAVAGHPTAQLEHVAATPRTDPGANPLAQLREFVRAAPGRYAGAVALGSLASAFAVALTGVSGWLIVRAAEQPAVMYLLVAIVGVRFFGLGRAILRYAERLVTHDAVFASATALRMRLWSDLARRVLRSRALQRGGTALDYLVGATDDVRDLVPRVILPVAVGGIVGVGGWVAATLLLPAGGAVVGACLLGTLVAALIATGVDRRSEERGHALASTGLRRFAAILDAADDLRGNGVDLAVRDSLAFADRVRGSLLLRAVASRGLGASLTVLVASLCSMAMLWVCAGAVPTGALSVEVAAVLVLLPVALLEPLLGLVTGIQRWPALAAALAATRIETGGPDAAGGTQTPAAPSGEIALVDLAATWPQATGPAFLGVTARAARGEWIVVTGPSGSGKSTMLATLLGGLEPSAGRIELDGTDIALLDRAALRQQIAWCPQDAHLFDSTVRANLLLGRPHDDRPTEDELIAAMRTAGLGAVLAGLPDGLDTRIGSEGSMLSGGQRQRLAIARTLLSRAPVILLDEPTAHLDEDAAAAMMSDLRLALADRIVVLVTHHGEDLRPDDIRVDLARGARLIPA